MKRILEEYIKLQQKTKSTDESSFLGYNKASSIDPVKKFLELIIDRQNFDTQDIYNNVITYYTAKLYSFRGTLMVFDVLKEMETLHGFKVGEYQYSPSGLTIDIKSLNTQDISIFLDYLEAFMGSLLYYHDIQELVKQINLELEIGSTSNFGGSSIFYSYYTVTEEVVE